MTFGPLGVDVGTDATRRPSATEVLRSTGRAHERRAVAAERTVDAVYALHSFSYRTSLLRRERCWECGQAWPCRTRVVIEGGQL